MSFQIEVTSDDLSIAHIWQAGEHDDAENTEHLHWSRYLRNEVSTSLRLIGAKPTKIMRSLYCFEFMDIIY